MTRKIVSGIAFCPLKKIKNESVKSAYDIGGYSLNKIGVYYNLHYSRVCKILELQRKAKSKT